MVGLMDGGVDGFWGEGWGTPLTSLDLIIFLRDVIR